MISKHIKNRIYEINQPAIQKYSIQKEKKENRKVPFFVSFINSIRGIFCQKMNNLIKKTSNCSFFICIYSCLFGIFFIEYVYLLLINKKGGKS